MKRCTVVVILALWGWASLCSAQSTTTAARPSTLPTTRPTDVTIEALTEAEQIVRSRKAIETDKAQIAELDQKLNDPNSDYRAAEAAFGKLDGRLTDLKARKKALEEAQKRQEALAIEREMEELTESWDVAREQFGLAVEERKALQEKLQTLQKKLEQDNKALAGLQEPTPAATPATLEKLIPPTAATASAPTATAASQASVPTSQPAVSSQSAKPKSQVLVKAIQEAETKKVEAQKADERLQAAEVSRTTVAQSIESERKLLEISRKKQQQAAEEQKRLRDELNRAASKAPAQTNELSSKIAEAQRRESRAAADAQLSEDRVQELEEERARVAAQEARDAEEASTKKREAEQAEKKVRQLQNPFALRNMLQWILDHGPKLVMICLGMTVLQMLVRVVTKRIAKLVANNTSRGSVDDRQNRAYTLVSVFRQTASLVILGGGTMMLLDEIGVPVVPLLGGAAVVGLAVAFGAQNLIRDYFAGFMVLVEDQYSVGDVVRIGSISGLVERITLRMTMLRDMEGTAHFIPHGSISTVSNMTHSWSQAMFEIPIAYKENVDRVMQVLLELAQEMNREPAYDDSIVGEPEMLGVDALGDSAVIIKFLLRTRPKKQWTVKRELLRRIKNRFDTLGIEIPYPHMTVIQHPTDAPNQGSLLGMGNNYDAPAYGSRESGKQGGGR